MSDDIRARLAARRATTAPPAAQAVALAGRAATPQDVATRPAPPDKARKPRKTQPADLSGLGERERGFRERAAAEDARFNRAVETEFWFTIGFATPADLDAFLAAANWADLPTRALMLGGAAVDGYLLAQRLGIDLDGTPPPPRERVSARVDPQDLAAMAVGVSQVAAGMFAPPVTNPLAALTYRDGSSFEEDCDVELAGLLTAFRARDRATGERRLPTDSGHFVAVVFLSRADKDELLRKAGWWEHGDKYLDGDVVAELLGIDLS